MGWYRRVFEVPEGDAEKRISVEFDGAYRETKVVFNGFYIGRHSGGYDPFRFDLADFVKPGAPNVLLVQVDATLSDGWFYEGTCNHQDHAGVGMALPDAVHYFRVRKLQGMGCNALRTCPPTGRLSELHGHGRLEGARHSHRGGDGAERRRGGR